VPEASSVAGRFQDSGRTRSGGRLIGGGRQDEEVDVPSLAKAGERTLAVE